MKVVKRKGIIMAGGSGSRLAPTTEVLSKHLFPVYNKPMIYYPLTTLMLAGVSDVLIVTNKKDKSFYYSLLGDGTQWGIAIQYAHQESPRGLADGLIIAENFLEGLPSVMVLGDNIFYGDGFVKHLQAAFTCESATVFSYKVADPSRYAIVEFKQNKQIRSLEEKPQNPKSDLAITGLYFYPEDASQLAKTLNYSARKELEITDLNNLYHEQNRLSVTSLGRGITWFDVGTHDSLLEASQFVRLLEARQGQKIAWPEEVAHRLGYI